MRSKNILLFGLFDTAIMTARCFQYVDVVIYGMDYEQNHFGFSSKIIKSIKVPSPNENEKNWLEFVLEWMDSSGLSFVLIPTTDEFVQLCAKYFSELSKYCLALIPDYKIIETILERDRQFNSAVNCGLNVPSFIIGNKLLPSILKSGLRYPLAIKPINVTDWKQKINKKGFVIKTEQELHEVINQLDSKHVRYLVQNVIEGDNTFNFEVNSLYLPDGRLIQHVIRKIRQYPDGFGTATCIEPVSNPYLEELAATYIRHLNIAGFSNIEFKLNPDDNKYYYIETNTRVWLQVNFSSKLGVNFPVLYYNFMIGKEINNNNSVTKQGKWVDFLPDLLFWKKYHKNYNLTFLKFILSWFPVISTCLFSIADPIPFLKDLKIKKRINHILRKAIC